MESNVITEKEAQEKFIKGIKLGTRPVRLSYGPKGLNAVIESDLYPYHEVINDAQTVIQAIQTNDPYGKMGLSFLKELSDNAEKDSGDGRKTTCILWEEMLNTYTLPSKEILDSYIPVIEKEIDSMKNSIGEDSVKYVAQVAGESERLGNLIGEIYKKIGKDGIVHIEGSGTWSDYIQYIEGVRFSDAGYLSPYMSNQDKKAVYEKPVILVTKKRIETINDINPLLEKISLDTLHSGVKTPLVIFTDDMDSGVASLLVNLHRSGGMSVLVVKAPVLWKNYIFEDFAKCVGATIVEDATGVNFKNLKLEHLGTCGKITTDRDETLLTGIADISSHVKELEDKGDNDSKLRLSWLRTKTAILKLGANNESELSHLRKKAADAVNSSRLALADGIVLGAGYCLAEIAKTLPEDEVGKILKVALTAPYKQITESGVKTDKKTLEDKQIYDAAKVVKNAVRNAISLASTVLTTGILIKLPEISKEEKALKQLHF